MTFDDSRRRLAAVALAVLAFASGCRGEGYQTSVVTGTVTYKGKPVANLRVEFAPADGPKLKRPPATGVTRTAPQVREPTPDLVAPISAFHYVIPQTAVVDVDAGDTLTLSVELVDASGNLINGGSLPAWLTFSPSTWTLNGAPKPPTCVSSEWPGKSCRCEPPLPQ